MLDKSPSGNPDFPEIRNNFSRLSCQSGTAGAVSDWFGKVERSANGVPQVRCQIGRQMSEFLFQRNIGCHLGSPWARFAAMSRTIRSIGRDFV